MVIFRTGFLKTYIELFKTLYIPRKVYQCKGGALIMESPKKHNSRTQKIIIRILFVLLALVLALVIAVTAVWHNELATLGSIRLLRDRNDAHNDGAVYSMHVHGGFYLEDFIEQGGTSSDLELIDFITGHLTKGLLKINIEDPEIACSSFTARSADGDMLFGRNYDFSKTNTCLVFTEAQNGRHATISTTDLQFLGLDTEKNLTGLMDKITALAAPYIPLDGINDAGVSCGIYMTYQGGETTVATDQNTDKPDFTSTTLLRLILDYADNIEDAVKIASSFDLHDSAKTSYHYMVADASGRSAILEWVGSTDASDNDGAARQLTVTYNDQDSHIGASEATSDLQVITNFILQPGYYDDSSADDIKGFDRYTRLWDELHRSNGQVSDEKAAMDLLQIVGRRSWNNDDSNGCTVHSAVYNLTDKTMLWVSNENFNDPSAVFEFGFDK